MQVVTPGVSKMVRMVDSWTQTDDELLDALIYERLERAYIEKEKATKKTKKAKKPTAAQAAP